MGARIRAFDWASTPLGQPEEWPAPLRTTLRIMLTTQHPMFIFWGPDSYCFYNDAYSRSLGPEKHASMLGSKGQVAWPEIWDIIGPQIRKVMSGLGSTWHENQLVPIRRFGRLDEVYWTYSYGPIDDTTAESGVGGVLVVCTETTQQVLAERRQAFLVEFDTLLRSCPDADQLIVRATDALGRHLRVNRVGLGEVQADQRTIRLKSNYTSGVAPLIGVFDLDGFGAHNIARHRQGMSVVCDDVQADPEANQANWAAIEVRAFVSVPLTRDGLFCASLFVNSREPRDWSPHEVDAIEIAAARIWGASERRRADSALRASEARFRTAFENAAVGIAHVGLDGRWLMVNDRLCSIVGYSREELLTGTFAAITHPDDLHIDLQHVSELLEGQRASYAMDKRFLRRDGTEVWVHLTVALVRTVEGAPEYFVSVVQDITQRKDADEKLRRSEAALQDAGRRKDGFLAMLAHELRNPLAPIRTAAQILGSPRLAPHQLQWAQQVIQRQSRHMAWLLDDLLDVARITQGKLELKRQPLLLKEVVETAVETSRPLLEEKHHQLVISLPSETVALDADPLRLSQVMSNLLTNAAKYTDPGGRIEFSARLQGFELLLSVKDNGIGISAGSMQHIFEMFSQAPGSTARSEGGLGIGLALVKGLVELHGGRVEARSSGAGQGSEFTVQLPLATPGSARARQETPAVTNGQYRILVVDDNRDGADGLALLLGMAGHEVRAAYGGREGLALARSFQPDIAIIDLGMPDLNGYDVVAALQCEPWARDLRLVALSGWGQAGDRKRAAEAGFHHHLTKPADPAALAAIIAGHPIPATR